MRPSKIQRLAQAHDGDVYVWLRLAQDSAKVWRGKYVDIQPPGDGVLCWFIDTELPQHTDLVRRSMLDGRARGVSHDYDEALAVATVERLLVPGPPCMALAEFLAELAEHDTVSSLGDAKDRSDECENE